MFTTNFYETDVMYLVFVFFVFGTKYVTAKQTHTLIKKAKKWYQVGQIFTLEKVQGKYFQRNK